MSVMVNPVVVEAGSDEGGNIPLYGIYPGLCQLGRKDQKDVDGQGICRPLEVHSSSPIDDYH